MYAGSGTFDTYLDYMDSMYGPETSDADLNAVQYYQNILGADIFEQPAQPAAPAIAGVQPAQEQEGTWLDYVMAAGENFVGSGGRTIKSLTTLIPRLMFDYAVNRNVPFTEVDDVWRQRIDAESAFFGVPRDVLQNRLWKNIEPEASYVPGVSELLSITDRFEKRFARRPEEQKNTVAADVAGAVGSFVPTLPLAFAGAPGLVAGAALYSAQGGHEAYAQARDEGATFEDSLVAAAIGAVPGAASAVAARLLVAQKMLAGWNTMSGGKIEKMADAINRNVLTRLGSAGAVEGASEILDELFIKAGVAYATDQDLLELENLYKDLAKSGEVGAETGIAIRAIIEGIIAGKARGSKGLSPTINDKPIFNEETGEPLPRAPVAVSPVAAESLGRGAATPFGPVQSRTIVDKYVQQATQQPDLLPIDTPVNEMAAIIAAEEGIDIGIATATARAVRERLDVTDRQNRPPQLTNYTKVDPLDPRTYSEGMDEEAARKEYNDGLRRFVADYKAYEQAQKAAQAQEVRQRQAMGGRAVTEKERKELRADINRKYTELAAQGERDVGEAQRTYLREVYVEELIAANRPALMAGNPTESEYQRRVRSLIAQDNRRPEMRNTPEAQRDAEFYKEKLLESYRQREQLDADELAQLEADYQVELDQIAAELQARQQEFLAGVERLTEAETPARKEEMQQLKDYLGLLKREAVRRQRGVRSLMRQRKEAERVAQFEMEQAQAQFGPEAETTERKAQMGQLRDYFSQLQVEYERLSKGYAEAARQRKLTIEQAEAAQKELNELFTGGMETADRDAKLKEMKADFLAKYGTMEGAPVRTEEQEAAYAEFEAALPGLRQAFETATDDARQAREDIEAINFNISSIQKEIRAELAAGNRARIKELQGTLAQAQDLLEQKQKEELEATKRVREARDNLQKDPSYIAAGREEAKPVAPVTLQDKDRPVPAAKNKYALTDKDAGVMLARSMPEVYGSANQQRRNGLQRALQVVAEPGREYVTIDDVLNVIPGKKDEKLQDRRLRVQEYLATLVEGGLIQPVDGGGQRTYHLTLATAESLRKEATPPAPTPQVQAAPAAAAAKPPVVLEFKTGPQKGIWNEVYGRIQYLPENEDIVEQYGQDVIDELVALDDAANSISVSNKAADLLRELFDDARSMIAGAIQSKEYELGTEPVSRQKIEAEYRIYEKYLEQLDRALNAPSAPPSGPVFGRPGAQPAIGKMQRIGPEAVVGQPAPGKTPYQYRIEAALKASVNAMDMDFVAPEARLEVGVATQQTIDNIERASDQQLLQMIDSSQPLGLQAVADVTEMDRFGQPIVKSVKVEVRALDKKTTTAVQWMAQRVLAAGELRRRAALAALNADVKRSEAARGAPSTPSGKFGRPRQFYDATTGKEMPADMRRGQPIIDLQDSPGNEGFGLTGTIEDTLDKPQGEPVNKLQLRDAVRQVADIVQAPLLVANMSGKPMVGTYDPRRNMIAVQSSFNFVASLHEVGHGIVATLFGAGGAGPRNLDDVMPPTVRAEMERLGRTIYGTTVPEGGYMHEGVAEFTAGYVLRPERYNRQYPATAAWYQDMLNKQPELARAMGNAQDLFSSYRFQGSEARQRATRVDRENPTNKNAVQRIYDRMRDVFKMETLERRFTNSMVSLANMDREKVKRIKTLYARAGKTLNDADLLEMLKSGKLADYGEAIIAKNQQLLQTWLTTAMTDGNGNIRPGSKSMFAVLSPLRAAAKRIGTEEHMRDFEVYLAAKRELALLESGRITVTPTGIVDMQDSIARIEARYGDAIKLTYADYMQWWSGALQYVKDNDPFLAKVFDKIEEVERKYSTSGTYVPLQRIAFDLAVGQGVKASLADAFDMQVMEAGAKPIAGSRVTGGALVGSPSPRFDVLQTAESSLQALLTMTHKRMLTRAVVNAGTVFDMKSYAYEIPIEDQPDLSTTSAAGNDAIGLLKAGDLDMVAGMAVVAEGKSVNADGRIIVDLVDLVEIPGEVEVDLDGNPVLDEDGNPKPATKTVRRRFSLDENVVHAIATVDPHEVGRSIKSLFVLKKILQLSSRTFKTFATGVNVSFQILAAPVMDFGTTFLNGTQPYCGLRMPLDFTYTMGRLALAEANVRYEPYEQYKALSGGFDSGWGSVQKNATIEAIGRSRRQKIIDLSKSVFTPWNGEIYALLERTLSFSSRTGRILEMKQALKQAGYSGTGPLSQEQATAAITALRRVTTNWSLTGTMVGDLNQIIPYFSVSFVTMRDYVRSANKQMSNPSTRVQYAVKTGALLGAAAAYWAMAHDDENEAMKEAYANASYEDRMRYWIFGYKSEDGTTEVVRIPNPMTEFLPAKMVQAALDGMYSSDPYATGNWLKTIITNFMPGLMPAPAAAAAESMWNKNDLNKAIMDATFNVLGVPSTPSATPLESSYGRGPAQERVTPYTSSAGALLSEILNGQASPRQMDQMLESFLAGAPDQIQSMLEMAGLATSNKPVAVQQAPGFNTLSPVSRFISKTGPYSMRSPKIQELSAALEAARKLKASTRVPETPLMALELRALEDAFGCVTALHYIANYHPTMSREQRQKLQKFAVEIAVDATGKVQRGAIAEDYQRWDPLSRGLKQQRELIENEALAQKPGYYPSIDWSKLLR